MRSQLQLRDLHDGTAAMACAKGDYKVQAGENHDYKHAASISLDVQLVGQMDKELQPWRTHGN